MPSTYINCPLPDDFTKTVLKLQAIIQRPLTREELEALRKPEFALQRAAIREGATSPSLASSLLCALRTRITTGTVRRLSLSPYDLFLDGPLATSARQGVCLFYAVHRDSVVGVLKVYSPCDAPVTATAEHEWGVSRSLDVVAASGPLVHFRRNVVCYTDRFDLGKGRMGLFMPAYVRSLQNFLSTPHMSEEHVSLPDAFLLRTALCVLRGLVVMHAAGIAHCDVKADNIMFGGDGTAALIDLGAATMFGQRVAEGIPRSMSLGHDIEHSNAKVDLVSLAVTLWWAVYGFSELNCSSSSLRDRALAASTQHHGIVASAIAAILGADSAAGALEVVTSFATAAVMQSETMMSLALPA